MRITPIGLATILGLLTLGCGEKDGSDDSSSGTDDSGGSTDDSGGGGDDTGDPVSLPDNDVTGYLALRSDETVRGEIIVAKAFSFYSDSLTFVYVSSNPSATCDLVAELFDPQGDPVDKNLLFAEGGCNMSFSVPGPPPSAMIDIGEGGGTVGTECAVGEGSWVWRDDVSFPDYYWSGEYLNSSGYIGEFNIELYQEGADHLTVTTLVRGWRASFPYTEDPELFGEHIAQGRVEGVIYAEHCEGLENSGLF
ncbi:MAG: hypothetical protein H6741_03980 [Alphaproteobacteria bacterium]|nr:hypothetical protein [Alphaproteobacteria bacterium]MCB9791865.1 hypothetical protein [Alphaproteobacteria bacterium]